MLAASVYALAHIVANQHVGTNFLGIHSLGPNGLPSLGPNGAEFVLGWLMVIHFVLGLYFLCSKEKPNESAG